MLRFLQSEGNLTSRTHDTPYLPIISLSFYLSCMYNHLHSSLKDIEVGEVQADNKYVTGYRIEALHLLFTISSYSTSQTPRSFSFPLSAPNGNPNSSSTTANSSHLTRKPSPRLLQSVEPPTATSAQLLTILDSSNSTTHQSASFAFPT